MKRTFFLILIAFISWSCDHNESLPILSAEDREIVEKAYSPTYMYPPGFNFQQDPEGSVYYENTVSIRTSQASWIELHTNERQQALDWSETSALTSSYYRDLVAEKETEKYYEFKRVYSANSRDVILSRVHKSSYFIPSFDKFRPAGVVGTLKVDAINEQTIKDFIEYMWTGYMIGYTEKVLEYNITNHPGKIQYNLKSVRVTYGDFGICDHIEVRNFDFFVDKESGIVTFESNRIKDINGTCR